MKSVLLIISIAITNPVVLSQKIPGEYTTVSESECNSELRLFKNGKGVFIDSCRSEDGTYIGDIYKDNISWHINGDVLLVKINGINEIFTYDSKLSCAYFGENGYSNGLVGFDLYFWRKPVKCK